MIYNYLATFHTQFDAMEFHRFAKTIGNARMKPVPRSLSSSCGTCVVFSVEAELTVDDYAEWPFERLFSVNNEDYSLLSYND